ncbi:hypothetical protein GCM10022214_02220 [Actinomadura miaoliensis]|uniref:Uncharacterized protein n=1 Tax=Actinomadura miaoliensis TaxID=430685 RepID=A0ABP7UX32_9ACTN
MRPEPTVKDRSWKTGVSSGQVKDRFEQTMKASDMEVTSWEGGTEDTRAPAADKEKEGTTARPRRRRSHAPGRWPVGSGYHPEMSSSTTMSGLPYERSTSPPE